MSILRFISKEFHKLFVKGSQNEDGQEYKVIGLISM